MRNNPARNKRTPKNKAKRPVRIEDLHDLKFVQPGSLSPDGSSYAFTVRTIRKDRKGYDSNLYVADVASGRLRQFSYGEKSDAAPVYSPDGRWIAFVGKRGKLPGIHLIPADGGEARPLVERDGGFGDISFSPDGRKILCTYQPNDPRDDGEKIGKPADDKAAAPSTKPPAFRHIQRLLYRHDGRGFLPKEEPQIWLFDIKSGEGVKLTSGKRGAFQPVFSPDGRRIAFVRNMRPDPDRDQDWTDIFIMSAAGGRPHLVPTPPGPAFQPSFSPDGTKIAYLGHDDLSSRWYENVRVWVVPIRGHGQTRGREQPRGGERGRDQMRGTGPARCLCRKFDQTAFDSTIGDMGGGFGELRPQWNANGSQIYFISSWHGSTRLYRVPARGGSPVPVTPDRQHLSDASLSRDGRIAAGTVSTPTMPPEVHVCDTTTARSRRLTDLNRDWASAIDLGAPKHVRIPSTDGTVLDGWYLVPPGFSPRKRYPAIIEVHGGPQTQYGYTFFHEMQLLAARGYVVLYSNPRGSQGYGRAFAEAIRGAWGTCDFTDVMTATDYLENLPFVNPKRIGITGGSYGGYMTNWAVGHTQRYRAAVTQRSVVDLVPFFGSSDFGFSFHHTFDACPWEDLEKYRRQSPLTYARNIHTPLLILHSENDMRCNIEQAENLFATLKMLKRKVELVIFPEEPHGLSRGGRPDRRAIRLEKIAGWFDQHL